MKLNITITLLFVTLGLYAQKQLQPYNYSVTEGDKTETIMIYASADAVNSITFTLKNRKNEILKRKKENGDEEEDITFKVFPFTEDAFSGYLIDNINRIVEKDDANKEYGNIKDRLSSVKNSLLTNSSNGNGAVKDLRNIYQFFNALVITAFDYDNEPDAGVLKYNNEAIVIKKNIDGLDAEDYFNRQAKLIRKLILEADGEASKLEGAWVAGKGKYDRIKSDEFLKFLAKSMNSNANKPSKNDNPENSNKVNPLESVISSLIAKADSIKPKDENPKIPKTRLDSVIHDLKKNIRKSENNLCESDPNCGAAIMKVLTNLRYLSYKLFDSVSVKPKNRSTINSRIDAIENELNEILTKSSDVSLDNTKLKPLKDISWKLRNIISSIKDSNRDSLRIEEDSYIMELFYYHQNLKRGNNRNARSVLKHHIDKKIKEWYNTFQQINFLKDEFANDYFKFKYRKNLNDFITSEYDRIGDTLRNRITRNKALREDLKKESDSLKANIDATKVKVEKYQAADNDKASKDFELELKEYLERFEKVKSTISQLDKENATIDSTLKAHKEQKAKAVSKAKKNQNEINFLVAENSNKILDVPLWDLKVEDIQIDFNDGFIEHITVTGKTVSPIIDKVAILNSINKQYRKYYTDVNIDNALSGFYDEPFVKEILKDVMDVEFKFDNEFPIGFSSKTDFADLSNYNLYAFEGKNKVFALPLTNVINLYIQRHQNDRLDFSPKDQTIRLPSPDDPNKEGQVELKKEISSKILNAKVFTDFNGFKEREPNGLVQFEVEKQVPLWTKRMHLGTGRSSNVGFANYAVFNLTWAKLNEEDRELQVLQTESFVNNESRIDNYITYLDLIRFENVSAGVDLNIASFDFPLIKTRVELNAGVHYGRVKVVNDVPNPSEENPEATIRQLEKNVNIIRLYPDAIVRIRPEERFGAYLRFRAFRTIVPDNEEFFTVYSANDFLDDPGNRQNALEDQRWLQRYELGAFYTPSAESDNKFFFRYRYTNTSEWETNGYSEIQVGYQIYLRF